MVCFLCKKALKDFLNTVVKEDSQDIGKICRTCNEGWKEFCVHCKTLKRFSDIKYDLEGKITCSECQKTKLSVCLKCGFRAIFICSCQKVFCKFCAETHFVDKFNEELDKGKGLKHFSHEFFGYGIKSSLPDFYKDSLTEIISFYYENEGIFINKNILFIPLERMADTYTQCIRIYKSVEYSIDPTFFALRLIQLKFASGYFEETKALLSKTLDPILSEGTQIEDLLNYLIYFSSDLDLEKSSQILQSIQSQRKTFSSKFKYHLFKAWFTYLTKKNDKKLFGEFISKNWKNPASTRTLQILTMTGLFTSQLPKLDDSITYLVFYFQSIPELSLLYQKKSTLAPDPKPLLLLSFQVILRFSDFSNESLVLLMINYLTNHGPTTPDQSRLYFLRLLQECLLNNHKVHLNYLIGQASTYITDESLVNRIKQLSL